MDPQVSIITINFNDRSGLERTLNSVFSQTYTNWEQIVIDGGSTDGSANYLEEVSSKLAYWVSESDKGVYHAMNKGIAESRGDFVLFLNSGDELNGGNALADFVSDPNFGADINYGDYRFEGGGKQYPEQVSLYFMFKSSLPHQSTLFRRELFDRIGTYNENYKITSDREFYIKCLLSGEVCFCHIPFALSKFEMGGRSNNNEYTELKRSENETMLRSYFGPFYEDYSRFVDMEHELNGLRRNKLVHLFKRIRNKLK